VKCTPVSFWGLAVAPQGYVVAIVCPLFRSTSRGRPQHSYHYRHYEARRAAVRNMMIRPK